MKKIIFILLLLAPLLSKANMAEPIDRGTLGSRPFTSQYVDIIHENLKIKIDKEFNFADFTVEYHIQSSKDGLQVPFLFYANELWGSFEIFLDGKPLEIKEIPYGFRIDENSKMEGFISYFENSADDSDYDYVLMEELNGHGFYARLDDMVYFETDILKGKHTIKVSYRASSWKDGKGWVNAYSFRYALSPAKYWKSFGTLDLEVDARDYPNPLSINIGPPDEGNIDAIGQWHLDGIPINILQLSYTPEVSLLARILMGIGTMGLAAIVGLIMVFLHLRLTYSYRKKHLHKKYSVVVIVWSLIIPLLFFVSWILSYGLIDRVIGAEASGQHGYSALVIFFYPLLMPIYWAVFALIDYRFKKRLLRP